MLTSTTNTMTYLLAGIAAVSLLVGGIGIMNIMLVSVTERTREIGLRLSVGARDLDVLHAVPRRSDRPQPRRRRASASSSGSGVSDGVSRVMQWTTVVTSQSVALSFGVAAATGMFFGFYPARKAAALDPIEALEVRIGLMGQLGRVGRQAKARAGKQAEAPYLPHQPYPPHLPQSLPLLRLLRLLRFLGGLLRSFSARLLASLLRRFPGRSRLSSRPFRPSWRLSRPSSVQPSSRPVSPLAFAAGFAAGLAAAFAAGFAGAAGAAGAGAGLAATALPALFGFAAAWASDSSLWPRAREITPEIVEVMPLVTASSPSSASSASSSSSPGVSRRPTESSVSSSSVGKLAMVSP